MVSTYARPLWEDKPPNKLFSVKPLKLKFPVRMDSISCSFQLSNKSDNHVSFRVKSTDPLKYYVQPKSCILLPRSQINVTVTMRRGFSYVIGGDEFLVQCVATSPGTSLEEITPEMFNKEAENHVEECKLIAANYAGYIDPVETYEDHTADSSGSSDHEITSPKKLLKWRPRRYNGGGGMSILYVLLIAVGFLLGYYVRM